MRAQKEIERKLVNINRHLFENAWKRLFKITCSLNRMLLVCVSLIRGIRNQWRRHWGNSDYLQMPSTIITVRIDRGDERPSISVRLFFSATADVTSPWNEWTNKRHAIDNQIQFKTLPVGEHRAQPANAAADTCCCITKCVNDNTPLVLSEVKNSSTPMKTERKISL